MTATVMAAMILAPVTYARKGHGKDRSHGSGHGMAMSGMKHGKRGYGNAGKNVALYGMLFKKVHFILMNAEELQLTDDQRKSVKAIKTAAKKDTIRKNADIEIVSIDILSQMHEDKIDTASIHSLLDKKFNLKGALAKGMIDSFAKLNGVLSSKQQNKLKSIYHKSKRKK